MSEQPVVLSARGSQLELSPDGGLSFTPAGGQPWRTDGPFAVVHFYDRQHPRAESVLAPFRESYAFGTPGTVSASATCNLQLTRLSDTQARVHLDMSRVRLGLDVLVTLNDEGTGFALRIEEDGVDETNPLFRLLGLEILPNYGAAVTGEKGYMTLPNWAGTQCFFDKSYPREVRQSIYSTNDQWEYVCNMPVFGITREHGTLCGIVSEGETDAELICRTHWEEQQLNGLHPYLVYRWAQQDELLTGTREVSYAFAPADDPSGEGYVFCGKTFRRYLQARRGLQLATEKAEERPEFADYYDRFFLKIFMAYKNPQPDGRGDYHVTTTMDEARQIIQQCLDRGIKRLAITLVGWGLDGHDGACPTYLPVDERVGGNEGFKKLLAWAKENDVMIAMHTSHNAAYRCSPEFDESELIRHRTGEIWESVIWGGGHANQICPKIAADYAIREVKGLAELGVHGHHHFDAIGSFMTCYNPLHPVSERREFMKQVRRQFRRTTEIMGSVSTEMPFGPYFGVVDGFFASYRKPFRWHRSSPIGRYFFDRSVPLLSVILHGSASCCESIQGSPRHLMEVLEFGLRPQAEVSMRNAPPFGIRTLEQRIESIEKAYELFYAEGGIIDRLAYQTLEARREIAPGVTENTYADGSVLRVNINEESEAGLDPTSFELSAPQPQAVA